MVDDRKWVILRCFCASRWSLRRLIWCWDGAVICRARLNNLWVIFWFFVLFLLAWRLVLRDCRHRWSSEHLGSWACWSGKACLRSCESRTSSSSHSASSWTTTSRSRHSSSLCRERISGRWLRLTLFLVISTLSRWIYTKRWCCRSTTRIQEILDIIKDSTSILTRNKLLFLLGFRPNSLCQSPDRGSVICNFTVIKFLKDPLFDPNGKLQEFLDILTFTVCATSGTIYQSWSGSATGTLIIILTLFALLLLIVDESLNLE